MFFKVKLGSLYGKVSIRIRLEYILLLVKFTELLNWSYSINKDSNFYLFIFQNKIYFASYDFSLALVGILIPK